MSGSKVLLDSNIIIYLSQKELELKDLISLKESICISVITYIEVIGFNFKHKKEEQFISAFCSNTEIIELNEELVDKVIHLRKGNKIRLPDAIIAASAIVSNARLINRNTSDFNKINSLKISNPFA